MNKKLVIIFGVIAVVGVCIAGWALWYASLKELPLSVSTRKALTGPGRVVTIENRGDDTLRLTVTLESQGNQGKNYQLVMDRRSTKEIGHVEGWSVVPGDRLTVNCPGYRTAGYKLQ